MKKYDSKISLLFAGMLVSASLAGCSGGGSSSSTAAGQNQNQTPASIVVTPSLGKFSAGTKVNLNKIDNSLIASGTVGTDGTSTITLPLNYTGPIVVEVLGGAGVTYYDEKDGSTPNFAAGQTLRAVMPSVKATVGVTPLTNAAVAILETGGSLTGATADSITVANSKVAVVFGLSDILLAPTPVDAATATGNTLNVAKLEDKYALVLAALAKTASGTSNAAAVADALALDLKDGMLDGKAGTGTNATTITSYTPTDPATGIAAQYTAAATAFADATSVTVIASKPIVITPVVPTITVVTNQSDVSLAKAMFADLRTTATSLSNTTKTGFLDTKATSMSADLTTNVGPDMEKVISRIEALGYAAESLKGFNNSYLGFLTNFDPTTGSPAMARGKGSINSAMNGWGGMTYCWSANPAPISAMSCIFAGSNSGVFTGTTNGTFNGTLKMLKLDITQSGPNAYSYAATRVSMPVYSDSSTGYQWQPSGVLATASGLPVGNGTYTGTVDGSGKFLTATLTGTLPPSSTKTDPITGVSAATGLDHFSITANRTALTTANSSHVTLVGTVSSDSLATPITTNASFSFDAGTYIDMQQTTALDFYGQTIDNLIAGKVIGTYKTAATQFTGTIDLGASVMDFKKMNHIITSITAKGTISDISTGGVGDILTGTIAMTEANAASFDASLPISSTNYHKQSSSFTGTVQAPSRPLMTLVVAGNMTGFTTSSVTLNYSYGTVSITGNATVDSASLTNTLTLSNQDGIAVAITSASGLITGAVSKSSNPVASFTSATGIISYVDGFSETLN